MSKKSLAAGSLLLLCNAASAQSNVTLYGIVDAGVGYLSNQDGKRSFDVQSGWVWGSRLGFKGNEDLGSGKSALFVLENGFAVDTGALSQGGRLFGRQSYLGLADNAVGTLTVGKQYDPVFDTLSGANITVGGGEAGLLFAHPFDNDNTLGSVTAQNSVKFTSAKFGGLTMNGMVALGETAGNAASNRLYGAGLNYSTGPFVFGATFERISQPGANLGGAAASDQSAVAGSQTIRGAGMKYQSGLLSIGAAYTQSTLDNPISSVYAGPFAQGLQRIRFQNIELNAKYQLTPSLSALGMVSMTTGRFFAAQSADSRKWQQVAVMLNYFLSRRTDIYFQAAYQYASGGQSATTIGQAQIVGAAFSSNANQTVVRVGLKQTF